MEFATCVQIEIPSKTFVIGEYLALQGTVSLLLATEPPFIINITEKSPTSETELHPQSPGGKLYQKLGLKKLEFSILDPHQKSGGFGRSTAEYLSVFLYNLLFKKKTHQLDLYPDLYEKHGNLKARESLLDHLKDFVKAYQEINTIDSREEYKPSGADLVAQVYGDLCWYDGMNFSCQKSDWPFPGYDIYIFRTGSKQNTHEHLKNLKNKNLKILIPSLMSAKLSLKEANLRIFCQSLNNYYDILGGLGLSDKEVRDRLNHLREQPEVLAAKGCGAMGMDTALVVGRLSDRDRIKKMAEKQSFSLISSLTQSHPGVRYTINEK